jgi:uncharacterized SAM-dependent methyltransferase
LPPKFFYDRRGAEFVHRNLHDPRLLSDAHPRTRFCDGSASEIAHAIGAQSVIIEYGAGEIEKVRTLLECAHPAMYVGWTSPAISGTREHAMALDIRGSRGRRDRRLSGRARGRAQSARRRRRIVFFPGSTIGNFEPKTRA